MSDDLQRKIFFTVTPALFSVVVLLPLIALLVSLFSLQLNEYLLDWYRDREVFSLTLDTVLMAFSAGAIALIIGLPVGLVLGVGQLPVISWRLVFFLPLAVPPYLGATCWVALLGRKGVIPEFVGQWFVVDSSGWIDPFWGSSMILGFSYFPIVVYLIMSGMRALGRQYEEAAMLLMVDYKVLLKITLPLLQPHIITGFLLVFLLAATNYAVPALLGYKTLTIKIYTYFSLFQNISGVVYLALPLLLVSLLSVVMLERCMAGKNFFSLEQHREGSAMLLLHNRLFRLLATCPAVSVAIIPVVYLAIKVGSLEVLTASFQQVRDTLLPTFILTLLGSLFLVLIAFPAGYMLDRVVFFKKKSVRALLFLPFALPSILLAVGVILVWNRPLLQWGYDSAFVLVLLWGVKFMPLAQRIIADHVNQIPRQMEEAAELCKLTWFEGGRSVIWPLSRSGFLVSWAVVYLFCLAELGGTLLVIPPGFDSMPIRLYNMMHYGTSSLVAGLGVIILSMAVVPLIPLYVYGRIVNRVENEY